MQAHIDYINFRALKINRKIPKDIKNFGDFLRRRSKISKKRILFVPIDQDDIDPKTLKGIDLIREATSLGFNTKI